MQGELPHPPAPPGVPRRWHENPLLPQGLGLAFLALVPLLALRAIARSAPWVGILLAPALLAVSALAAWAAAIHLTGGEKFDDHPWV